MISPGAENYCTRRISNLPSSVLRDTLVPTSNAFMLDLMRSLQGSCGARKMP